MWLLQYFTKNTAKDWISERTTTVDRKRRAKYGQFKSYDIVVKYLLKTYATDYIIEETDYGINSSKQGYIISPPEYAQNVCSKALSCGKVYSEDWLKGIFIKGLHEPILRSVRGLLEQKWQSRLAGLRKPRKINGQPVRRPTAVDCSCRQR